MKYLLIFFTLILLFSGCSTTSKVTFHTQPPGGVVVVDGVTGKIADGEMINLEEGKYTLFSEKEGFAGVRQELLVDADKDLVITVPLGSGYSQVTITTIPAGESVLVEETGQVVRDGATVPLAPGTYSFLISKKGYRDNRVSQEIDGLAGFEITVPLGEGFGTLNITASPAGSTARINNGEIKKLPLVQELPAGSHEIIIEHRGSFSQKKQVTIKSGTNNNLTVSLKKIPTSGAVTIKTDPAGGKIYFEDKEAGQGSAELGVLAFGSYRVHGEKMLDSLNRLVGETTFDVKKATAQTAILPLNQKQSLFEQQWMPTREAERREEKRYRKQRVGRAVALTVPLSDTARKVLTEQKNLAAQLHTILRVGDRLNFITGGREIKVWKRNSQITPAFQLEVADVLGKVKSVFRWKTDNAEVSETVTGGKAILADIALLLHSKRHVIPLCDLNRAQLSGSSEEIFRTGSDGPLFLVIAGGTGLTVDGQEIQGRAGVVVRRIPVAGTSVKVAWKKPPERVLLVSDRITSFQPLKASSLMMQEKNLVSLSKTQDVKQVLRLSSGPDYTGWKRKTLEASGPLAGQIDLRVDEIGPHALPGTYQRVWIVRYQDGAGLTQRQLAVSYQVGLELKDGSSKIFLRRTKEE